MTRPSKQSERRARSPRKCKLPGVKTGALRDQLPLGYKHHPNAMQGRCDQFIPTVGACHVTS